MRKLHIANGLTMAQIRMSAAAILNSIKKVHLAFRSTEEEEMANLWKESRHLITCLRTTQPGMHVLLGQIAVLHKDNGTSPPLL